MDRKTVPYLFYSTSDSYFPPGTLVMAAHVDGASDEELLCLGRRHKVISETDSEFLERMREFSNRDVVVVSSGTFLVMVAGEVFRERFGMCEHSMRLHKWRLRKEREATLARWKAQG